MTIKRGRCKSYSSGVKVLRLWGKQPIGGVAALGETPNGGVAALGETPNGGVAALRGKNENRRSYTHHREEYKQRDKVPCRSKVLKSFVYSKEKGGNTVPDVESFLGDPSFSQKVREWLPQ
ncbi:hypothetical protein STEG23_016000, partial [Scotinomys teguina]